jgi:hypothetical protein
MNYFFNYNWVQWANNEPAMDFQWWLNFMRSGDPDIYRMARAMSRHTMDVDNTHWPRPRWYRGDTNRSLDWFEHEMQRRSHRMWDWPATCSQAVDIQAFCTCLGTRLAGFVLP